MAVVESWERGRAEELTEKGRRMRGEGTEK